MINTLWQMTAGSSPVASPPCEPLPASADDISAATRNSPEQPLEGSLGAAAEAWLARCAGGLSCKAHWLLGRLALAAVFLLFAATLVRLGFQMAELPALAWSCGLALTLATGLAVFTAALYAAAAREAKHSNQAMAAVTGQAGEDEPGGQTSFRRFARRAGWLAASGAALGACWLALALPGSSRLRGLSYGQTGVAALMLAPQAVLLVVVVAQLAVALAGGGSGPQVPFGGTGPVAQ